MKIPLKEFAPKVELLANFVLERDTVPALRHIHITKDRMCAFNGAAGAVCAQPWGLADGTTIPGVWAAKMLMSLERQGHEMVECKITERSVAFNAQRFTGRMPKRDREDQDPDSFLTREVPKAQTTLNEDFWAGLARVEFSICENDMWKHLRGVYWDAKGGLWSCDNNRATLCRPGKDASKAPGRPVLIPDYLIKLFASQRSQFTGAAIDANNSNLWFLSPDSDVYGLLLEGEFPISAVSGIISTARAAKKKGQGTTVTLLPDRPVMDQILDRLGLFTEAADNFKAIIQIEKDGIILSVPQQEGNQYFAEEAIPTEKIEGATELRFAVNVKSLKEALAISKTFWYKEGCPLYVEDGRVEHALSLLSE